MRVGEEALGAVGDPFHRHAGLLGGPQADDLFRVDVDLRAEAAADIRRDDAQLVFRRDIVEGAHHQPRDMRVLRRRPAGVVVLGLVVVAERCARLHGVRHQPVVQDVELDDMRRLLERRGRLVGIAEIPVEDQVVLGFRVDLRRALVHRLRGIGDRLQFLVGDLDRLGGVARLALGVGHHDHHRVADIADLVEGQRRPCAHLHRRAVLGMDHPAADQIADAVGLQFLAGQHAVDAGHGLRLLDVDLLDLGMRVGAAHECRVFHSRHNHVVDIASGAGDEPFVFLARNACADAFDSHKSVPPELPIFTSGEACE